jgi:3',5'-cyclic AMP phosphodiesterase CpdA
MRLVHLSDWHVGRLPWGGVRGLLSKRIIGFTNWHVRRRFRYNMVHLDRVLESVRQLAPDHIACTGDFTHIGLPHEWPAVLTRLKTLGTPETLSVIPGNHDVYVPSSLEPMLAALQPWMTSDNGEATFPYCRIRGEFAIIGLNSAIASGWFMATGRLGEEQRDKLATLLRETREKGLCRVVLIHHPPTREGAPWSRNLLDATELEAVLHQEGAELILHGHNHVAEERHLGNIPILGAPSVSVPPYTGFILDLEWKNQVLQIDRKNLTT